MLRTFLIEGALFLTPFALYGLILLATRGSAMPEHWSARAIGLAGAAAIALVVISLAVFEGGDAPPGSRYVPAQVRDGVLVPGHFE